MLILNQLSGFDIRALTSIEQVLSATSLAASVTGPSGILPNDLLVLVDTTGNNSGGGNPTTAVPSGFTTISNDTFTTATLPARKIVSFKLATGAEAGASLTGMSGTAFSAKMLYVFRGGIPIQMATAFDPHFQFTTGTPTNQTLRSGDGSVPVIALAAYGSTGTISPRGFSPTKDGEINPDNNNYLAYKIFNTTPSDVTVSMEDEGENHLSSFYIACA